MSIPWQNIPLRRPKEERPVVEPSSSNVEQFEVKKAEILTPEARVLQSVKFGTILGSLCGAAYGVMDSFSTAEGRKPENLGQMFQKSMFAVGTFGGIFGCYQGTKEICRSYRGTKRTDPYDPVNSVVAASISVLPMALHPMTRKVLPHMAFLVIIDGVNDSGLKLY